MAGKTIFKLPYAGIDHSEGFDLLYGDDGDFSIVIAIQNPVSQYGANPSAYDEYHNLLINIVKILGDGYILQKQDIFSKAIYPELSADEYLQKKYNAHFCGRHYVEIHTYLVITKQVKRGAFYVFDKKALRDFKQAIGKVLDILSAAKANPSLSNKTKLNTLVMQILSMNFSNGPLALDNITPSETELNMGGKSIRNISLVNIDSIDLPSEVGTHVEWNEKDTLKGFPVDFLSFLLKVPGCDAILYNQVIEIPSQGMTLKKLELKKKRHSGIPDPANMMCVEDIDQLLVDVARENQLLVNCHFNIVVAAGKDELQKACNYIESALFGLGIIASKNAYNQLELFRSILPGNAVELKKYDWFLTTCDAALCFFFKESQARSEPSDFLIRFTDRQGIPIGIDPADLPMRTGRINNRNKFVLGPSGSGKSFFMNALIEQYMLYNMDMVIVDTGHSYSGLCSYYNGKYITYTDKKPITMNPFQITEEEYNIEKKDFLGTLIGLLWKGADGAFSQVERDVITNVISAYYSLYFDNAGYPGITQKQRFNVRKRVLEEMKADPAASKILDAEWEVLEEDILNEEISEADELLVDGMDIFKDEQQRLLASPFKAAFGQKYRAAIAEEERLEKQTFDRFHRIEELNFNSFYEYAIWKIPEIKLSENISFDTDEFRYVLKKFYKGGEFAAILNEPADKSLFSERFIVFEIDSIKENRVLFPIVTLIIMDVFIQKMRFRSDRRKALVVEEAWKAIASPLMAGYLLYLYKTVRKFWGEAIVVTQELGDIIGNAVVKDSIVNNSDTICLLDQTKFKDNYNEIAALLSINETERKKIFTINQLDNKDNRGRFKEFYIRRGSVGEVYGIEVAIEQYLTYTTEKPEKSAVEVYTNAYGSYPQGLDEFILDLKKSKQSLGEFISRVNQSAAPLKTINIQ
jgi:hypothetical protein